MKNLLVVSAVWMAFACNKKQDEGPPPGVTVAAKTQEAKPKEPAQPPAAANVPMTSKSPEAVKLLEQGADLMANARGGEALPVLGKAIELDPDFAQAHALLGVMTPGKDGADHLAKAVALSGKLPDAEKEYIAALAALSGGDEAKAIAGLEKVVQLAPGAWRVDMMLANLHNGAGDTAGSIKALDHALSINPKLPQAQNGLAYAHAQKREWDQAIEAAKKQVELLPKEPNPEDTLGEVQLWAGKFDDSEQSFQAAIKLDPSFKVAWQGVGLDRAYKGDYKGAYEAFDQRKTSTVPGEKFDAMLDEAWVALAEGKLPKALELVDSVEKDPAAKTLPVYAFAPLVRGQLLAMSGKSPDAAKAFAVAKTREDALPGNAKNALVRQLALGQLWLAAMAGKPDADSDKLVAALDDDAKAAPNDPSRQSTAAFAHGLAAWAKSGAKDSVAELSKCLRVDVVCRTTLATAKRKAGDAAGADAIDKEIQETPVRDAFVVYARASHAKK